MTNNFEKRFTVHTNTEQISNMIAGVNIIDERVNIAIVNGAMVLGVWRCSETLARVLVGGAP